MVFSSFLFLFIFLPLFLALYYALPRKCRNGVALTMSLLFYSWGAPQIAPLLVLSCLFDFFVSKRLGPASDSARRAWLSLGIVVNLGLLGWFKYANFFVAELDLLRSCFGLAPLHWNAIALPIGISFFTFHKLSYLVDIYRGVAAPVTHFSRYLLYILFFPQLIAGPIIRYHDVADQLVERTHSLEKFFAGLTRFCFGLGKKVLIADTLGAVVENVFALEPNQLSGAYAWLGALSYAFQIYFDFSGYSDMALGLANMVGFQYLENFNKPYAAQSVSDFWKRWHISLTNFMREYLYIPLGGNQHGALRTYFNLWIVFLLSGLWHGASWNFIFWGAYQGLMLTVERMVLLKWIARLPLPLRQAYMFLAVLIGWVFFRAETLPEAFAYLGAMFGSHGFIGVPGPVPRAAIIHNRAFAVLLLAAIVSFAPAYTTWRWPFAALRERCSEPLRTGCAAASALAIFLLALMMLASAGFSPFLYFKF